MSESATVEHDTTQTPVGIAPRGDVVVVDNTNFNDFVDSKLPAAPVAEEAEVVEDSIEAKAKAELKEVQKEIDANNAPKEGDSNAEGDIYLHGKWQDKRSFAYRLHMGTQEKMKEADAKVDAAKAEAKAAREKADTIERERNELRQKYEPPKSLDVGPEPMPEQFSDVTEYSKAIKEWTADKTRHDDRVKAETERQTQERARISKDWDSRMAAFKAKNPDYQAKIEASPVKVSDDMRDAIVESEFGPEILDHFADNPDVAERLGKLSVRKMLVEFGKLETTIQGSAEKPQAKSETQTPIGEVSKAPAPITPLRGASAVVNNGIDKDGQFHGTFEEYKARRLAGKIK